jgi:hypothetical protein
VSIATLLLFALTCAAPVLSTEGEGEGALAEVRPAAAPDSALPDSAPPDVDAARPAPAAPAANSPGPRRAAPPAAADARTRVLVLDVQSDGGVPPEVARTVGRLIAARLEKRPRLDVTAAGELRALVDFEAQRIDLGCEQESCLAEIAGALGADVVFFGNIGALGGLVVLSLGSFDTRRGAALARETVEVERLEDLPRRVAPAVDRLAARALGGPPPAPAPTATDSPWFWVGAAGVAVGTIAGVLGGGAVALALPEVERPGATFADVEAAKDVGRAGVIGVLASAAVAAAGVAGIVAAFVAAGDPAAAAEAAPARGLE